MTPLSDLKPDPGLLVIHSKELWEAAYESLRLAGYRDSSALDSEQYLEAALRRCCKEPRNDAR